MRRKGRTVFIADLKYPGMYNHCNDHDVHELPNSTGLFETK
jgi:hypothetical protein